MTTYFPDSELTQGTVLRRFALFVDGMARAMLVPFGPALVYRLANGSAEITPSTWSSVSWRLALVMGIFIAGHSAGNHVMGKLSSFSKTRHYHLTFVARLGGVALSLHLFSLGAGLSSAFLLMLLRFLLAVVVGILCTVTESAPGSSGLTDTESTNKLEHKQTEDIPETAKIYVSGFAISSLVGGGFYVSASANEPFQMLTGTTLWSPLFFIAMAILGEILLRGAFALAIQPEHLDRSSGTARKVRKIVRRIVGGERQRVSFKDLDPESMKLIGSSAGDALRPRSASANSFATDTSEYFDCNSDLDEASAENANPFSERQINETEVAQYVNGKCCYADGSAADVPPGDCAAVVPANYIENCGGNRQKAMKQWRETQRWRREREVWRIHKSPNPFFFEIKKAYPHFAHGYSKSGIPVMYEQPGKMNLKALFQGACSIEDMVHHYIFFQEFLANCLCASKELRRVAGKDDRPYTSADYGVFVVMDIAGAGISMLSTDILRYLTRASEVNSTHYPLSMKRVCVVNCPFWASGAFGTIKKVLPDSVQTDLFSNNCIEGLRQYIDDDQIPPEYGGSSPYKLGEHPYEKKLQFLVENAASGDVESNDMPLTVVSSIPEDLVAVDMAGPTSSAKETTEISSKPVDGSVDPNSQMRRRTVAPALGTNGPNAPLDAQDIDKAGVGVDSLAFVSFFCAFWSATQGAAEIAVPLLLTSPVRFGGLGYSPSASGVVMFCASLLLFLILTTTKASRLVVQFPSVAPLRALRLGLGAQGAVVFLLAAVPIYFSAEDSTETVRFSTIILLALGALAGMLGRTASSNLRRMVTDGLFQQLPPAPHLSPLESFIAECSSGRAAHFLGVIGEVAGVLVNSQIWSLSINRERPSKYDGSLCLILPSLLMGSLYFFSHFLRVQSSNKSPPESRSLDIEAGVGIVGDQRKAL